MGGLATMLISPTKNGNFCYSLCPHSQVSINGVGLTKPPKQSNHLRKPSKGGR